MEIASYLLGIPVTGHSIAVSAKQHFFEKQDDRKNCSACYKRNAVVSGRKNARNHVKKTYFICKTRPERPRFCHECFAAVHNSK